MKALAAELPDCDVFSSEELGLDPDAKEAIAFAILARESWDGAARQSAVGDGRAAGGRVGA
jgi:1,6-anhydro-N-acetylmuramate kinase